MSENRKRPSPIAPAAFLVLLGALVLTQALSRQRLAEIRAIDVLSLTGAGFCFGASLVLFVFGLRSRS